MGGFCTGWREHASLVHSLFGIRRPPAIVRLVWAGTIYPVQRVPVRRWSPHKFGEAMKIMPPLIADRHSDPSVAGVVNSFDVITPTNHAAPDAVQLSLGAPTSCVAFAMGFSPLPSKFALQAAARLRVACFQVACNCHSRGSTVAQTKPMGIAIFRLGRLFYSKPTKFLTNKIVLLFHERRLARMFMHGWLLHRVA